MPAARRITAKTKIYQLKIQLRTVRPPVWRRVLVPADITLGELHDVLQIAMGWTNSHLHEFEVDGARYGVPDPDWGMEEVLHESRVKLAQVAAEGTRLRYGYDFGDGWEHEVTVEKVLSPEAGTRYPRCVAGRRACPPEDVGGPGGYEDFLAALNDPSHDQHEHFRHWIGGSFDPADFDLAAVDNELVDIAWLSAPARRSTASTTSSTTPAPPAAARRARQ